VCLCPQNPRRGCHVCQ